MRATLRKIVKIDEEKCNGCGSCAIKCAEGALKIIDGKARLISDKYCDGLGACLGECPQGAITIEERAAEDFDEELATQHVAGKHQVAEAPVFGCPSARILQFDARPMAQEEDVSPQPSMLRHWPVQLTLVPPRAPFLQDADVLLAAHCTAFAYAYFHRDLLRNKSLLIACPKLDDFDAHLEKLTEILRQSSVKSLTVLHMEVPCCSGLVYLAKQAIASSGKDIPLTETVVGIRGDLKA